MNGNGGTGCSVFPNDLRDIFPQKQAKMNLKNRKRPLLHKHTAMPVEKVFSIIESNMTHLAPFFKDGWIDFVGIDDFLAAKPDTLAEKTDKKRDFLQYVKLHNEGQFDFPYVFLYGVELLESDFSHYTSEERQSELAQATGLPARLILTIHSFKNSKMKLKTMLKRELKHQK